MIGFRRTNDSEYPVPTCWNVKSFWRALKLRKRLVSKNIPITDNNCSASGLCEKKNKPKTFSFGNEIIHIHHNTYSFSKETKKRNSIIYG